MNRIHPKNRPILELPKDHPAHATLVARFECQRQCAGREIPWPGREDAAVDQEWHSSLDGHSWRFSGFVYSFVCFDLILNEWIDHPPHVTESEKATLTKLPDLHGLLDECQAAALRDANAPVLEMIPIVRRFFSLWEKSIRLRIEQDGLTASECESPP
ncbi:MAG TPA: hypothetical protein VMP01_09325 [Pirellulaceae bacterium]|nr:hypothetical protein [Pirellulaceae bacterium]